MSRQTRCVVILLKPMDRSRLQRLLDDLRALALRLDGVAPSTKGRGGSPDDQPGGGRWNAQGTSLE